MCIRLLLLYVSELRLETPLYDSYHLPSFDIALILMNKNSLYCCWESSVISVSHIGPMRMCSDPSELLFMVITAADRHGETHVKTFFKYYTIVENRLFSGREAAVNYKGKTLGVLQVYLIIQSAAG